MSPRLNTLIDNTCRNKRNKYLHKNFNNYIYWRLYRDSFYTHQYMPIKFLTFLTLPFTVIHIIVYFFVTDGVILLFHQQKALKETIFSLSCIALPA